jgi:hypothetical protein
MWKKFLSSEEKSCWSYFSERSAHYEEVFRSQSGNQGGIAQGPIAADLIQVGMVALPFSAPEAIERERGGS